MWGNTFQLYQFVDEYIDKFAAAQARKFCLQLWKIWIIVTLTSKTLHHIISFLFTFQSTISKEMLQECAIFICLILIVLHKHICLYFFVFILLSVLSSYVFVSLSSVSHSWRFKPQILGVHIPNTQQVVSAVIVTTRPEERGEQARTLHSGSSKGSKNPCFRK